MQTVIVTDRETRERPIPDELTLPMPETEPPRMGTGIPADGADDGVVSPELVLVDPTLRHLLASRPPPPPTTAASVAPPDPVAPQPAAAAQTEAAGAPLRVAEPRVAAPALPPPIVPSVLPKRRRWWPIVVAALVGGVLAAATTIVLLPRGTAKPEVERVVDPSTGSIGQPAASTPATQPTTAAAVTTAPTPPRSTTGQAPKSASHPVTRPATTAGATRSTPKTTHRRQPAEPKSQTNPTSTAPTKSNRPPPATTTHQKLAWAPAAGATAYDIELLRDTQRVFHTRTSQSSVVIVVRKGAEGPAGSLRAGEYEWIVWPIVHGHRAVQAIVRSRLTLSG